MGRFADALSQPGLAAIAEVKRRSPSAGDLRPDADPGAIAAAYERAGAAAASILVDERFGGTWDDLRAARERGAVADDAQRRSLERELHDGAQQQLVALAVSVQLVRALMERDPVGATGVLDDMARDAQQALESTTRLALRIHPPLLDAGGLGVALRAAALANGMRAEINAAVRRLPSTAAGAVYFCWLDVLESARDAQPATVDVASDDSELTFDLGGRAACALPDEVLTRMRDRVEALGGRLTVESAADGRTSVRGWIPLSR